MTSIKIRFLFIVTILSAFTALPITAHSAIASNPGSISGGSVTGGGNWAKGVSVGWSVAFTGSAYLYSYTFDAPSPGPSSPGWPEGESIYGIKFEGFTGDTPWTFTLLSARAPMEGDFYAKGGRDSFAYNSGFGALGGANILVPDSLSQLGPEPGMMLLLGSGLLGIAVWVRRRMRMQN